MILDELRAVVLCDRQAAFAAVVQGADVEIPDWHDERAAFDEALEETPATLTSEDGERLALRRALRLPERRGR